MRKMHKLEQSPSGNTYDYNLRAPEKRKQEEKHRQHSGGEGSSRTVMDYERYGMYSVRSITSTNDSGSSEFLRGLSVHHVKSERATARKNILRGPFLSHQHPECTD
jgi:hypothetical protein